MATAGTLRISREIIGAEGGSIAGGVHGRALAALLDEFRICWTHEGTARLPASGTVERLDGTRSETGTGSVEITGSPVLLS
jgi:hypothetical protein